MVRAMQGEMFLHSAMIGENLELEKALITKPKL